MKKDFLNKEQFDNAITSFVLVAVFVFLFFAYRDKATTPETKTQIVTAIIGFGGIVIGFRWGSSRSASRKDETINQMLNPDPGSTTITTTQTNKPDTDESKAS